MIESLSPSVGWTVVHLFCKAKTSIDAESLELAKKTMLESGHQVVSVALIGHKADVCFMLVGPDFAAIRRFQTAIQQAGVEVVDSFLSLTEISEYAGEHMTEGMRRARLYPELFMPENRAWCFYPMSKRRGETTNWYQLDYETRKELLYEHGMSGRNFGDRVLQVVTGSTGVDDFEWAVTLFAKHPNDLKDCVYTMRYDEASAKYGEFGTFYTGMVVDLEDAVANLVP